ncbi:MAG: hypothetical protein H7301_07010 [Cryobacterium sp.]|nr:hypothetical protein [Oligoflexia bacterium]
MSQIMKKNVISQVLSLTLTLGIALSPITPAFADGVLDSSASSISSGDAAKTLPDVGAICTALKNASVGNFKDKKGDDVKIMTTACQTKTRRERLTNPADCFTTMQAAVANQTDGAKSEMIGSICASGRTVNSQEAQVYCSLQQASKNTQSLQYCEAYESAQSAEKGVIVIAALDVAAAGICWAEALSMAKVSAEYKTKELEFNQKRAKQIANHEPIIPLTFVFTPPGNAMSPGNIFNSGACGGAAFAAGMGEIVQTSIQLMSGKHSSGGQTIDGDGNVAAKQGLVKNIPKIMETILSAGGSLTAMRIGVCYYQAEKFPDFCKGLSSQGTLQNAKQNALIAKNAQTEKSSLDYQKKQLESCTEGGCEQEALIKDTGAKADATKAKLDVAQTNTYEFYVGRANLAKQAAIIFTGLTAMRGVSIYSAENTKGKAKDLLQSLFTGNGTTSAFGLSGATGSNSNLFTATGSNFTTSNAPASNTSAAVVGGSPESFLLPSGSPLASQVDRVASQIPHSKVSEAAAGGAAGMAGLVSSVAASGGARGAEGEISGVMASAFANFSKDAGAGYSGGGAARSMASKGDSSGGDLNLKSLFGGAEEKDHVAAGNEMAFRDVASSDDIWHSKNPRGNNLFQIVSDKYDSVQRKVGF